MSTDKETVTLTANTKAELEKEVQDLIAQGWETDGPVNNNPDGSFSQKMVKK